MYTTRNFEGLVEISRKFHHKALNRHIDTPGIFPNDNHNTFIQFNSIQIPLFIQYEAIE